MKKKAAYIIAVLKVFFHLSSYVLISCVAAPPFCQALIILEAPINKREYPYDVTSDST